MSENESLNIKPEVNSDVIHDIIWRNYNFQVLEIQKLNGYEDLNFKIRTLDKGDKDGCSEAQDREYVLKIINRTGTECRKIVETHHKLMVHLYKHNIPVSAPVLTVAGKSYCKETLRVLLSDTNADFLVQLLHYITGVTFLEAGNPFDLLLEVGRLVGRMDAALKNFKEDVPKDEHNFWELTRLPDIASHIPSYCKPEDSRMGQDIVRAYEELVLPKLDNFQSGVIHGDVNNCNIIVKPASEGNESQTPVSYVISGLIDFGDASSSFYVYEIATIMADIMASCFHTTDSIRIAKSLYQGYSQEFALNTDEVKSLKLIICIRALQAYVLSGMDAEATPDNEYLTLERQECIELCRHLWEIDDSKFLAMLVS